MKKRIVFSILIFTSIATIILTSSFPPPIDLPQHLSQMQLLKQAQAAGNTTYVIRWAAPNTLIYYFILLFWQFLPSYVVAKVILLFLLLLWIGALFLLTERFGSPPEALVLASLLVLNRGFYWGFLNFLIGFPIFVLWFLLTTRERKNVSWGDFALLVTVSFLLYESHALWFAAGIGWLVVANIIKKTPRKVFLFRSSALLPCCLMAVLWFDRFSTMKAAAGLAVAPEWSFFLSRFSFSWLMDAAFGGIWGPAETLIFLFIYGWVAYLIWTNRERLKLIYDKDAMLAGLYFLAIVFIAPTKYMNTIFFSSRWLPVSLTFLILGLRPPAKIKPIIRLMPVLAFMAFIIMTAISWHNYEKYELSGLKESLDGLPSGSRVLGLDLVKDSHYLKGQPFLQMFSYAQAYKKCDLNFSFAEHDTGLVAYRDVRRVPWTKGLEWFGEQVKRSDFRYFDYVLANAEENIHEYLFSLGELRAITDSGRWRLYRVNSENKDTEEGLFSNKYLFLQFKPISDSPQ